MQAAQAATLRLRPRTAATGGDSSGVPPPVAPAAHRRPPLSADQRREIAGLLPGLAVHTCILLFAGCDGAHCGTLRQRAQLLLVVAMVLLELAALRAWPSLSAPPLRTPRSVACRLLFCSAPAFRLMGLGLARAVERPPLPGPLGALADAARILIGAPLACCAAWCTCAAPCCPLACHWPAPWPARLRCFACAASPACSHPPPPAQRALQPRA